MAKAIQYKSYMSEENLPGVRVVDKITRTPTSDGNNNCFSGR